MRKLQGCVAGCATLLALSCAHDEPGEIVSAVSKTGELIDLVVSPSTKLAACQLLEVRATMDDSDGAVVSYEWEVSSHPGAAAFRMAASGRSARFAAQGPGQFDLRVTAVASSGRKDSAMVALAVAGQGDCLGIDGDGDGVPDVVDSCPATPDPDGADANGDGVGDACTRSDGRFDVRGDLAGGELAALRLDGRTRPAVVFVTPDGTESRFVEDEVIVVGATAEQLDDFLVRRGGVVLGEVHGGDGLPEMSPAVLVRVRVGSEPLDALEQFFDERSPDKAARFAVSSAIGLRLLAITAGENARGLHVTANWAGEPGTIPLRSTAEGTGPAPSDYRPNAFTWPQWASGPLSILDIGVGDAWVNLWNAGRLVTTVTVGILDEGFDGWFGDLPGGSVQTSLVPLRGPGSSSISPCDGGSGPNCWYHGANTTLVATGAADNGAGAAGTAGPIARALQIWILYDAFSTVAGVTDAARRGARVINMSYANYVPAPFDVFVVPLEGLIAITAGGNALLVAGAGNKGWNITPRFVIDWMHIFPCEGLAVLCIGATNEADSGRASYSNWSSEDGGVDLFAPGTVFVGPTPMNNMIHRFSGTSAAAPFVAGVAALVMTANPALLPPDVRDILIRTAHISGDPAVRRWVNAAGAVDAAFRAAGNQRPIVRLMSPITVPATQQANRAAPFRVAVTDIEDGAACCATVWTSDIDGELGRGMTINASFGTLGRRIVSVRATDRGGLSAALSFPVDVVNTPPTVSLYAPSSEAWQGIPITLTASASDPNEPGDRVPCDRLTWIVMGRDRVSTTTGCTADVTFDELGSRSVTVIAHDSHRAEGSAAVSLNVSPAPANHPPEVALSVVRRDGSPVAVNDRLEPRDAPLRMAANATDDDPLQYFWFAHGPGGSLVFLGSEPVLDWNPSVDFPPTASDQVITIEVRVWDGTSPVHPERRWLPFRWAVPPG